ncbi:MAG: response regulator transcription factor [Dehalococcoidaceae bacterium]|nr:response regulator transcription factor [Dehalococcoidaceae bacterium]
MKILIIDDDPGIVENLELTFKVSWPESEIRSTGSGDQGIYLAETHQPDVIILDLGLPDINGLDVLKKIRLFSGVPIVVLTVKNEENTVVKAISSGADEFIVKPFRQMELLARINAIFRRKHTSSLSTVNLGPMVIDFVLNTVTSGSKTIKLTSVESIILHALVSNIGQHMSCAELARHVWGDESQNYEDNLRVHIRHLRQKIELDASNPHYIITITGMGYCVPKLD